MSAVVVLCEFDVVNPKLSRFCCCGLFLVSIRCMVNCCFVWHHWVGLSLLVWVIIICLACSVILVFSFMLLALITSWSVSCIQWGLTMCFNFGSLFAVCMFRAF